MHEAPKTLHNVPFKTGYFQKQKQTPLLMEQSGVNSITLYTYLSELDVFLETGATDNMFEFTEAMQHQQNNRTVRTSTHHL